MKHKEVRTGGDGTTAGDMTSHSDSRNEMTPSANDPPFNPDRRGATRSLCESLISLFIAVLLFRTFAAEGYMISTGSMAPSLLGFHKRVECPTCGQMFAFGVAYDTDNPDDADELTRARARAVCPNCGQAGIDISEVPRNHGDQLLVNKQAFLYRAPRRWEVIVFRNPAKPTEAYVKRVVGLPGEHLQLYDGDALINGQRVRKTYEQQCSMRILVHDHSRRPRKDPGFQPHWQPAAPDAVSLRAAAEGTGWHAVGNGFELRDGNERRPDREPFQWLEYRHWIRSGGLHDTSVFLEQWPVGLEASSVPPVGLRYDSQTHALGCTGALLEADLQKILSLTQDPVFTRAMQELYELSHVAPLTDDYGYNPVEGSTIPNTVRDVMVSMRIQFEGGSGELGIQLTDGARNYAIVFDTSRREVRLLVDDDEQPLATADWPKAFDKHAPTVEMSLIDQQIVVAVDGQPLMSPWPIDTPAGTSVPRVAVRIGGRGLDARVDQLLVYRDVYYTSSRSRNAVNRPFPLSNTQLFVLGDNSPVSHDSRRWDEAPVDRSLLLGKPFLVHLPSKPGRLRIGKYEMHLRLPDSERIRFLK